MDVGSETLRMEASWWLYSIYTFIIV